MSPRPRKVVLDSPWRSLIDEVAGFGEDMRRGHKLTEWQDQRIQPMHVCRGEILHTLETLQERFVCPRDQPKQEKIGDAPRC